MSEENYIPNSGEIYIGGKVLKIAKEDPNNLGTTIYKIEQVENLATNLQSMLDDGVKQSGNTVAEQLNETDAVTDVLTFSATIESIEIYHGEATSQDFVVNGLTLTIESGGWRSLIAGTPSAEVTIPTGVTCSVKRLV